MNDLFLRQRVSILSGLTKYQQEKSNSPINLIAGTSTSTDTDWVDLFSVTNTAYHYRLIAYQITLDPGDTTGITNPFFRILAENSPTILTSTHKVFPFPNYVDILSGTDEYLQYQLHIPPHYDFKLQVYAEYTANTIIPTANLDYLSIIRTDPYTHE